MNQFKTNYFDKIVFSTFVYGVRKLEMSNFVSIKIPKVTGPKNQYWELQGCVIKES